MLREKKTKLCEIFCVCEYCMFNEYYTALYSKDIVIDEKKILPSFRTIETSFHLTKGLVSKVLKCLLSKTSRKKSQKTKYALWKI